MIDFSESTLVEQPAIALFEELGWETANCFYETYGPNGTLGRETRAEVVLVARLRGVLERLNPDLPAEAINLVIEELTRDRSAMTPAQANREIYKLLKNGIRVDLGGTSTLTPDPSPSGRGKSEAKGEGEEDVVRVRVIDWDHPEHNEFFLASQFWISGEMYTKRADLVGFVNGLPLVFIELKAAHKRLEHAYQHNLRDYNSTIPHIFWYNAFIILSNGSQSKIGSMTAEWEHFNDWKKINSEGEEGIISLETMIRGTCEPERLLDLVENFTLFSEAHGGLVKLVAKNHQYLGVNNAINALIATLTPSPSPSGRGEAASSPEFSSSGRGEAPFSPESSGTGEGQATPTVNYRGGFDFSGLVKRARELRQQQTPAEAIMWELLRDRRFQGLKFRRQHQIGNYIVDFYCHDAKLVVELDGPIHDSMQVQKKDHKRDAYLTALGIHVIRIPNQIVLDQPEEALKIIQSNLPSSPLNLPSHLGKDVESEDASSRDFPSPPGRGTKGEGASNRRLGVFWHTQGSGKSYSMIFFAQKVLRKIPGNWTFVIVTDRQELDDQIYKNFANAGVVTEPHVQAESGEHLKQLLREDHRYVFTLIQKFRTPSPSPQPSPTGRGRQGEGGVYPLLSDRSDIIVITDEAHRSQYDIFALNMRNALPNAAFIGFTGTPLMVGEEKTREVFGDYVSIYNFKQSVDDKATVPLYYENRIPELQLTNENLNEDMEHLLEEAELDEEQEKKLEREFAREYHLITRDDRLEKIAEDIVAHFMGRGHQGKAMVVSIDKATAVRVYDKVQKYWKRHLEDLRAKLASCAEPEREELKAKIKYMEETDMAVVVSQSQNEIEEMKQKGLDIIPHRKRMVTEDLDKKFKDSDDPFRIVFVCAMWMTGFDVPCCSTIYLDKPMRNHTLMQTIARANRVFRDKLNGLIVDYVGVFRDLQKALAIYGSASGGGIKEGETPVKDKGALVEQLRQAITETAAFCDERGIDLSKLQAAQGFERVKLLDDAVEAILVNDESKRKYLSLAGNVASLFKAILPDPAANEFGPIRTLFAIIAEKIRSLTPAPDISEIMGAVEDLLDESVAAEAYVIREPVQPYNTAHLVALSEIDFEALKRRFEDSRKRIEAEKLRGLINSKLQKLVRLNKSRMDFLEEFQKMIEEYNLGARNVESFFNELITFAQKLNEEEKRHIAEQLTEEELAIFDLLTKPEMKLSKREEQEVKKVAQELLETLKREKLVLDWRKRQQSRAAVRLTIEEMLDQLPTIYSQELYRQKCDAVYQHVYDSYFGLGRSVYA